MADQPPRKRRWFSFSLRAFLAAVFLIAILLGVLTYRWQRWPMTSEGSRTTRAG